MRILHVASHRINVGDGALNGVIEDRLRALAGGDVEFVPHDVVVDRRELSPDELDSFDLVIVGGGGGISCSPHNAGNGTSLPASLSTLMTSRVPFGFVALGENMFAGEVFPHGAQLRALLTWCSERGHPFSVRNDGSRSRLDRLVGPDVAAEVVEVPDPGFFVDSPAVCPETSATGRYVLVQVAADRPEARFGADGAAWYRKVAHRVRPNPHVDAALDVIAEYARHVVDEHGLEVVFAPHVPADVVAVGRLMERLPTPVTSRYGSRPFRMTELPHPDGARRFFGAYAAAELVVGMRGHAVICGVGLDRPVVALSTHPKVRGFMEACDLDPWSVSPAAARDGALETLTASLLGSGRGAQEPRRAAATADFGPRLDDFLLGCLAHAGVPVP